MYHFVVRVFVGLFYVYPEGESLLYYFKGNGNLPNSAKTGNSILFLWTPSILSTELYMCLFVFKFSR